jgi:hypothetical protein
MSLFQQYEKLPIEIQSEILSKYPETIRESRILSKPLRSNAEQYYFK